MWPPSRGHLSCSASVDVAPRDIHSVPKQRTNWTGEKGECLCVKDGASWNAIEWTRKRERERELEEKEPQNNCSLDEFGAPYTLGSIPDTRRPNSTYFCDPNGMSQRLMFLPVFQVLCSVGFYRFRPCRWPTITGPPSFLLSLIRFLDHPRPFRPFRFRSVASLSRANDDSPLWLFDVGYAYNQPSRKSSRCFWLMTTVPGRSLRFGRVTCFSRQVFLFSPCSQIKVERDCY